MDPGFKAHLAIGAFCLFVLFPIGLWFQRRERLERERKRKRGEITRKAGAK